MFCVQSENCPHVFTKNSLICRPLYKKNPSRVTITCLRKAYCFWRALARSVCWHAIVYAGQWARLIRNYRIPPGTPGFSCFHYPVLYHHPLTNILFVCDTNTSYGVAYAIENIRTKAHQFLFSNLRKLWRVM